MSCAASRFREVLQLLGREASPYVRRRLLFVVLLVIAAGVLTTLAPVALKSIVDGLPSPRHPNTFSPLQLVALYVISQWLARTAGEVRGLIYARIERRIFRTLSERLFAHLMHLPLRFHLERHTGAISETLNTGLEGLQMILHHCVFTVLPVTAQLGITIVVLGSMAPPLFLALFCGALTFYATAFAYSAITLGESARRASATRVEAGAAIADGLLNYETVKYFTAEPIVQERVGQALARSENAWVAFYRRYACNGLLAASIFTVFLGTTTWYAMLEVRDGHMTVGGFVLVNTYMLQLIQPVEMLGYAMQGFSQGLAMLEKMLRLFRETPEPGPKRRVRDSMGPGTLEFARVSLAYRTGRPVLTGISFKIAPRHTLGIVGPSGSGKSTIVRLLMRLLEPDEGQILLDDIPLPALSLLHLRRAIAVVPQDTALFNDTLAYNIAFGRPGATLADIQQAARVARLHEFITDLPDGYETIVGERGVKLSGGEKQRVSIARAALKRPNLYVFDEATSSLDAETELDILRSLRDVSTRSSTLVIAHRLSTVVQADEILVLTEGRIAERGTHSSLLRENGRYAALWNAQNRGTAVA